MAKNNVAKQGQAGEEPVSETLAIDEEQLTPVTSARIEAALIEFQEQEVLPNLFKLYTAAGRAMEAADRGDVVSARKWVREMVDVEVDWTQDGQILGLLETVMDNGEDDAQAQDSANGGAS